MSDGNHFRNASLGPIQELLDEITELKAEAKELQSRLEKRDAEMERLRSLSYAEMLKRMGHNFDDEYEVDDFDC